jgi:Secretion system C-terminal sorting domain
MSTRHFLLTIIFLGLGIISKAQTLVHFDILNETGTGEYTTRVLVDNLPSGAILTRESPFSDSVETLNSGDTLYAFHPDYPYYESVIVYYNNRLIAYASIDPVSVRTSTTLDSFQTPSSTVNKDGSVTITFDRVIDPSTIAVWSFYEGFEVQTQTTDEQTYTISNIPSGTYVFDIYVDDIDPEIHFIQFMMFIGDATQIPNNELSVSLSNFQSELNNNCDGSFTINPINAIGNVSYTADSSLHLADTNTFQNLCSGNYRILVSDSSGKNTLVHFYVEEISDYFLGYNQNNLTATTDTIFQTIYNCDFDYSVPLDSIHYFVTDFYQNDQYEYNVINFAVFQGGDSTLIQVTNFRDTTVGNFPYIRLRLNCTTDAEHLYTTRSGFVHHKKMPVIKTPLIHSDETDGRLYPNPVSSTAYFSGKTLVGKVYDLSGKEVTQFSNGKIDLTGFPSGIYFAHPENELNVYKIIKQ